jgi:uncharacterized membrane protein
MKILYCGDQDKAPLYISGALEYAGHNVIHIEPHEALPDLNDFDVYIFSDYPAKGLDPVSADKLIAQVASGKRFLMIGGWDSFNGFGSNYYSHPVGRLLVPVVMKSSDDRVNAYQGLILERKSSGKAVTQPDWDKPPVICGYNSATVKPGAEVLVSALEIITDGRTVQIGQQLPLVVKGIYEKAVVIACLTDLAPHWSGGLTDWGQPIRLPNGVQVGDSYLNFVQFLLEI